jgi:hypothetical protein
MLDERFARVVVGTGMMGPGIALHSALLESAAPGAARGDPQGERTAEETVEALV